MRNLRDNESDGFEDIFPEGQIWFTPKEVGRIIGRSDQFVRNCLHSGRILGHVANGLTAKGEEKRVYMSVHRKMLKLYLLETANYTNDMFVESVKALISSCNNYQLIGIEKHIKNLLCGNIRRR